MDICILFIILQPYDCNICDKSFVSEPINLNKHILGVHQAINPYHCNMCGKIFTSNHSLNGHMVSVHQGKKPLECNCSCSKSLNPIKSTKIGSNFV